MTEAQTSIGGQNSSWSSLLSLLDLALEGREETSARRSFRLLSAEAGLLDGAYFAGKHDQRWDVIVEWAEEPSRVVPITSFLIVCIGLLRNSPLY